MHQAILAVDNFPNVYNEKAQVEARLKLHLNVS